MLTDIQYSIPDEDPFFRDPREIDLANDFNLKHGPEFSRLIAKAVNSLVAERPLDPIKPFADAFAPIIEFTEQSRKTEASAIYPPLQARVLDVALEPAADWAGSVGLDIILRLSDGEIQDGISKMSNPPEEMDWRRTVIKKAEVFIQRWFIMFLPQNGPFCLKDYLSMDRHLQELFDKITVIPEPQQPPYDISGKKAKLPHPALKMPWPPKKNPVQRIAYNSLDDGFAAISLFSFGLLLLVAQRLKIPLRTLIRTVCGSIVPDAQWPITIPLPFVSIYILPKKQEGKLRILQEVMLAPRSAWNPGKKVYSRGTTFWSADKVTDVLGPLKQLMTEEQLDAGMIAALSTTELVSKGLYDIKGKPKGPESVLKILSALFRRDYGMIAVFNPINVEHRDKLKPFCEMWKNRHRQMVLFHEDYVSFNETLSTFPACFRGALVSIKGEDTVRSVIVRVAEAHALGIPICLENGPGLSFADPTILLEMAMGMGIEFIKVEAPGRDDMTAIGDLYEQLADYNAGFKFQPPQCSSEPSQRKGRKVFSPHAPDVVLPFAGFEDAPINSSHSRAKQV